MIQNENQLCTPGLPLPKVACESCKKLDHEKNHPVGMVFVGWGTGWQTCPNCGGTGTISVGARCSE
jgi:hypothetical protein